MDWIIAALVIGGVIYATTRRPRPPSTFTDQLSAIGRTVDRCRKEPTPPCTESSHSPGYRPSSSSRRRASSSPHRVETPQPANSSPPKVNRI